MIGVVMAMARAKTPAEMSQSGARVPHAWPFHEAPDSLVEDYALRMRFSTEHLPTTRDSVFALLDDRSWIETVLCLIPTVDVIVLEVLAELGGQVRNDVIVALACTRSRCEEATVTAAIERLHKELLTIHLQSTQSDGRIIPWSALLAPSAEHVAALVWGISLPVTDPPSDAKPSSETIARRDVLAVAGLLAHRHLRFNNDGSPHGAQLPRFAKDLGASVDRVAFLLREARSLQLLGAVGSVYAPLAGAVRYAADGITEELASLPMHGWVSIEAILRSSVRQRFLTSYSAGPTMWVDDLQRERERVSSLVKSAHGIELVDGGRETWVRRHEQGTASSVGHVTPSMEVMLGPRADLDIVAVIALGCELVRLERFLTFRITPESVSAGLSSGLLGEDLLATLDRVGRHPVAANVRAMVREWIGRKGGASLRRAWLLRVPEPVAEALASSELAEFVLDRPAPDLLMIDPSMPRPKLVKYLSRNGILSLGPPVPLESALYSRDEEASGSDDLSSDFPRRVRSVERLVPPLPKPLAREGEPALVKKVEAARANGFDVPVPNGAARLELLRATAAANRSRGVQAMLNEACDLGVPADLMSVLVALGMMYDEALPDLERWAARLPPVKRTPARAALASPLAIAAFLVLTPKARQSVLAKATSLDRLLLESSQNRDLGRTSARGTEANPLIAEAAQIIKSRRLARATSSDGHEPPPH